MAKERDTRQVLLDAAAEEFARYGLPGARMNIIVERAGINERMIYHHFESKVGLYEAVLAQYFRAPDLPAITDAKASFTVTLTRFVRALAARPRFLALALHEAMSGWAHVPKASLSDVPEVLRSSFEAAKKQGLVRKECRFEVVYLASIGAMVAGHLLSPRFLDLRGEKARDALVMDMLELVLRGMTP